MRDAFGGTFMIKLGLIFLVVYISIMAAAINYAKAFRVKNQIINIVEQQQFEGPTDQKTITKIDDYLASVAYNFSGQNSLESKCKSLAGDDKEYTYTERGACIITNGTIGKFGNSSRYYKVVTFIDININFFNVRVTIPVSGETKVIYD